jgi:glycosyltransferase involved in cell wall biosynthesis
LLKQDYPKEKLKIIIVDDKSTDDTLNIINQYNEYDRIKIIKHFKNRGLSASRNSGIKASKSEIVGFLDSDMVVKEDWSRVLVQELNNNSVVACMGGMKLASGLVENRLDKYLYNPQRGVLKHGENTPVRFKWFLFNNSAIKRSAINEVGYFDETITTYGGEDTDYAIRLWDKFPEGLRFTSKAVGEHNHQRPMNELQTKIEHYGSTTYLRLLEKYPKHHKDLAGDWVNTIKGKLIFNPLMNSIVKFVYFVFPIPYLVRYFIAYSLMLGARDPKK